MTEKKNIPLLPLIQGKWPELLLEFAKQCTFEIIAIGIMMVVAMKGYKKGMIASIHALVVSFGGVLAFGISFYLPFSAQSTFGHPRQT